MKRLFTVLFIGIILLNLSVPLLYAQTGGETPSLSQTPAGNKRSLRSLQAARAIVSRMSVADRVGQLFVVTFQGDSTAPESAIANLVSHYRVGGVMLLASNGNFRNEGDTPGQIISLTNRLQALAYHQILPESKSLAPSSKALLPLPPRPGGEAGNVPITSTVDLPLFIAIDQEGDGPPFTRLFNGFTPLPSEMALGATWTPVLAQKVGAIVGQELAAVGVNMLLGPSLDVVTTPRPELRGDFGNRVFGGDPYWVAQMGRAYIAGVHLGSKGRVITIAKHFPGQGGADRRPDEEVATVAKSLSELRKIELAPFAEVTRLGPSQALTVTDGLLSSHIRYEGFQGNIRERTPPISLAPELQDILALPEFRYWHRSGGILLSDALGALAVRRYKDPTLKSFPYKQVALEALLAGNDLLLISQFSASGTFEEQYKNTVDTLLFFQQKYMQDPAFRQRVDDAVTRVVARKLALYPSLKLSDVLIQGKVGRAQLLQGTEVVSQVARAAATLLHPGVQELADRLPAPPQTGEPILFLSDDRPWKECATCTPVPAIPPNALAAITLRLYGPHATNQIEASQVTSLGFSQLRAFLDEAAAGKADAKITALFHRARWIVIGMTDVPSEEYPDKDVVSRLLAQGRELLQGKHLIIFAFNAPYYLDATEISNLTAYYALYGKTKPFLETAVRLLFREFTPSGSSPVNIPALNYDLRVITEPAPNQTIGLTIVSVKKRGQAVTKPPQQLDLGDTITLRTSVIYDHEGHPVPDDTPVTFRLWYPADSLEFQREAVTHDGMAETQFPLERPGELWISVSSLQARTSTQLLLNIRPGHPGLVETLVPTPTPTVTPTSTPTSTSTPTPTPTHTPTPTSTPTPTPTPVQVDFVPWVGGDALLMALFGLIVISLTSIGVWYQAGESPVRIVRWFSWEWILGLGTYILFSLGFFPQGTKWRLRMGPTAGGILAVLMALMPLVVWGVSKLFSLSPSEGEPIGDKQ